MTPKPTNQPTQTPRYPAYLTAPLVFCTAPRPDYVKVKLLYRSIRNFCFVLVSFCALVFCSCFFWEIPLGSGRYVETYERNKARTKKNKKNKNSKRIRRSSQKMPQGTEKIKIIKNNKKKKRELRLSHLSHATRYSGSGTARLLPMQCNTISYHIISWYSFYI